MRNIIRVAVLDKVTDFLFFLGKLLIVGSVGILAFFFFTQRIKLVQDTAPPLNYYWVPILTVIVGSYLIAHGFFSVYGMCVDTLFLCFLEDLERNDGSAEKPYFMSQNLRKLQETSQEDQQRPARGLEPPVPRGIHLHGPWTTHSSPPRQRRGSVKTRIFHDSALNPCAGDDDELVAANEPQGPVIKTGEIPIPGVRRLWSEFRCLIPF
uniref:Choline transporter-like protein n=1 Tax=Cyanistes caeruleus TaxID=156563 RepID=A0A8C0U2P3_CYACU